MKISLLTIITLLFIASLTACALDNQSETQHTNEPTMNPNMNQTNLYEKKWQLVGLSAKDIDPIATTLLAKKQVFIRFDQKGGVSGFSGCNRFFGQAEISPSKMQIASLGSTRKACSKMMSFEAKVLNILRETNTYLLKDNNLRLYQDATELAEFELSD